MKITDPKQFIPSAGFLIAEDLEDQTTFKTVQKIDDVSNRIARVLKVGETKVNDFAVDRTPTAKEGDVILYRYQYQQDMLDVGFLKYPVINFDAVRGVLEEIDNEK